MKSGYPTLLAEGLFPASVINILLSARRNARSIRLSVPASLGIPSTALRTFAWLSCAPCHALKVLYTEAFSANDIKPNRALVGCWEISNPPMKLLIKRIILPQLAFVMPVDESTANAISSGRTRSVRIVKERVYDTLRGYTQ